MSTGQTGSSAHLFTLAKDGYAARGIHFFRLVVFLLVAGSASFFTATSIHWPLVGDSAQIHYICFLMDHGMPPYRVAQDMNMPGALLLEWVVMHTLGAGSLAWRVFDLGLLAAATGSMAVLAGPRQRLAGVAAGCMLLLVHGVDGLNDTGERDLSMAVFLLLAYAALFYLLRHASMRPALRPGWMALGFGLSTGVVTAIKPTVIPLVFLLFVALWFWTPRTALRSQKLCCSLLGFAMPWAAVIAMLVYERAFAAFLHGLHTSVPYYASLERRTLGYLLLHSVSPFLPAVAAWLLGPAWFAWTASGASQKRERLLLVAGVLFGLFSYLFQGKGFPYYRYPLLAFLLPLMIVDFDAALSGIGPYNKRRWFAAAPAAVGMVFAAGWLAPESAWKAHQYRWRDTQFVSSLTADLTSLQASNGQVQCIDSISGCGNTLLNMQLVQPTGLLSDFFIFGDPAAVAVRESRSSFQAAVDHAGNPLYLIVTSGLHLHPDDPGHWAKLARWPWFANWLQHDYTLALIRVPTRPSLWWSRPDMPAAYRIYVRNQDADQARQKLARAAGVYGKAGDQALTPLTLPEP